MAMTFTTKPVVAAPAQESFDLCKLELLNATESLNQAWMDLTDTQREIDGLQEIMDNVTQSVELLSKYGAEAIPMLNQDGGLEALLQIPERLITVEKAQEGLGEAAKELGAKFVDKLRSFFTAVITWINNVVDRLFGETSALKKAAADFESMLNNAANVKDIDKKISEEAQKEPSSENLVATESTSAAYFEYTKGLLDKSTYDRLEKYMRVNFSLEKGMFKDLSATISQCEKWSDADLEQAFNNRKQSDNPLELSDYNNVLKPGFKGVKVRPYDVGFKSHSDMKEILRPTGGTISISETALKQCRDNLKIFKNNLLTVQHTSSLRPKLQKYLIALYQYQVKLLNQCIIVLRMNIRVFYTANTTLTDLLKRATKSAE